MFFNNVNLFFRSLVGKHFRTIMKLLQKASSPTQTHNFRTSVTLPQVTVWAGLCWCFRKVHFFVFFQSPFNPLCVHCFCKAQKYLWRYVISPEASLEIWRYVLRPEASLEICCTVFCWTYQRSLIHWTSVSMSSSRIVDVASLWWLTKCGQSQCRSWFRTQQHTINIDFWRPLCATC